jgi:hypothetical protein
MKRVFGVCIVLLCVLALSGGGGFATKAQAADAPQDENAGPSDQEIQDMARSMGMDPKLCDGLQERINRIVAVSESSMSDEEKLEKLSEDVAESIVGMEKSGAKDAEVAKAANQYLVLMKGLLAAARVPAGADDKKVSATAQEDLQKLIIITKTYVAMMKVMCPKLKLPDAMTSKTRP